MRIPCYRDARAGKLPRTPIIQCICLLLICIAWWFGFAISQRPRRILASPEDARSSIRQPPVADSDFDKIVVRVLAGSGGPDWQINGVPLGSLGELRQRLTAIGRIQRDVPIILDPAREVPLGDVIDLFDLVQQLGFARIEFAVGAESGGGARR